MPKPSASASSHISRARNNPNLTISVSCVGPAILSPQCRVSWRHFSQRNLPMGTSLPDPWNQAKTCSAAILRVTGQVLLQKVFLVEQPPDQHRKQQRNDQHGPVRSERQWRETE